MDCGDDDAGSWASVMRIIAFRFIPRRVLSRSLESERESFVLTHPVGRSCVLSYLLASRHFLNFYYNILLPTMTSFYEILEIEYIILLLTSFSFESLGLNLCTISREGKKAKEWKPLKKMVHRI